ncbi:general L-amino acid ABC transporter membrane protein [Rhizobium sp. RU20A]|uniref:high-affinity branched-chain amino acid ABC transporter permease LivM n=1 Tax=Rhizobium sp. RU20A TaxID=1907412 RepID=UPI0009557023|nr:high-affinity branched-chain amino acid ABC transporter permease LivM [Rhizobium sp. RU20A]SIQ33131.1 general L-amino acid ABC transporter membrane protein [Rhizobium sp. RU20A]
MANPQSNTPAAGNSLTAQALREAFYAGLVSLGLFVLFVGLKTDQNIRNELILVQRWGLLAIFIGVAMVGRFITVAYLRPYLAARKASRDAQVADTEDGFVKRNFSKLAVLALVLFPPVVIALSGVQGSLKWVDNFGIQILIYVMLGWGLNIVVGLAGLLDLGYVAFYAVGAYSYALLASTFGLSFWILLPLAGILAAFWGMILGFPVLRLKGDYLAIVTLAFGEIIRLVLINWTEVTRGTFGVSGIPKATFFGIWSFDVSAPNNFAKAFDLPMSSAYYKIFLYYLILALALLTAYVTIKLRRMPIGRAWEALREDEIACRSLGINTVTTKLTAFSIGAMFGGFAGSFFAVRQGFVSPESFVFLESAIILAIVVLGGMGSLIGIAVAAALMIGGTELLREMTFLKAVFGPDFTPELYRMLIFGIAMVVVMVWKPRGFVGSREPTAFLFERKAVSGSFTKEGHG